MDLRTRKREKVKDWILFWADVGTMEPYVYGVVNFMLGGPTVVRVMSRGIYMVGT